MTYEEFFEEVYSGKKKGFFKRNFYRLPRVYSNGVEIGKESLRIMYRDKYPVIANPFLKGVINFLKYTGRKPDYSFTCTSCGNVRYKYSIPNNNFSSLSMFIIRYVYGYRIWWRARLSELKRKIPRDGVLLKIFPFKIYLEKYEWLRPHSVCINRKQIWRRKRLR